MSRLLKGLQRARCERGSISNARIIGKPGAFNPIESILENVRSDEALNRSFAIGIVLFTLATMALISASSQVTLNRTRQDLKALSHQVTQHAKHIQKVGNASLSTVSAEQITDLEQRFASLEQQIEQGMSDSSEAVIAANMLRVDVEDLKMSEHIYLDRYIAMHNEIGELKKKIQTQGRNL